MQIDKLNTTADFRERWASIKVNFPITLLLSNRDHYFVNVNIEEEINSINKASPNAKLYFVEGKHGFTLIHTDFIYDLITGKEMSKNPLTIRTV